MKQPRKHYAYLPCQSFKTAVDMDWASSYGLGLGLGLGLGPALLTEYCTLQFIESCPHERQGRHDLLKHIPGLHHGRSRDAGLDARRTKGKVKVALMRSASAVCMIAS